MLAKRERMEEDENTNQNVDGGVWRSPAMSQKVRTRNWECVGLKEGEVLGLVMWLQKKSQGAVVLSNWVA